MSKIIPTQADREAAADIVTNAVKEVNDRFPDWQPTPTMLGYARAVASAAAEALASHALAARIEGAREVAEAVREAIAAGYPEPARKVDKCAHGKFGWEGCIACYDDHLEAALNKAIRTLPTTIAGGQ